ncbi:hypothetical protein [Methylobacterium indicum]|uniref:Uncharacterized protein n=1 Tax=Methylobacterium indicum TaxID=1775910 RepID=A0A8H8WY30_9HYPH|nr:hypothetical protein [Methylobacterium indicum]BCM86274.1 hypothetical protein mvi_47350 [Methylobacterium indicum]
MSLIDKERTKLTATYLNTAAGGLFTAGVIAPVVAATFGVSGAAGGPSALTLAGGVAIFLGCSVGLHLLARTVLKGLKP